MFLEKKEVDMIRKQTNFSISCEIYDAVIFDLDGVVTQTVKVHAASWKKLFDDYFQTLTSHHQNLESFDIKTDYLKYIDGKPRYVGVKSFLRSRGIVLDYGDPEDPTDRETICGLGNYKDRLFREHLKHQGVEIYPSTVNLIHALRSKQILTAIVSSSKNCSTVLEATNLSGLFDIQLDGIKSEQLGLEGKPDPAVFLLAARWLDVEPSRAVIVEDAIAGVTAGRRGHFGLVIGIDRVGQETALKKHGADVVVQDLGDISLTHEGFCQKKQSSGLPSALKNLKEIRCCFQRKQLAVFLDYDGTLTPIVNHPKEALLSETMREILQKLTSHCAVTIISGRDLIDLQALVGLNSLVYAGSHGFDICGPENSQIQHQEGTIFLDHLDRLQKELQEELSGISRAWVERKKFSLAIHYRNVQEEDWPLLQNIVELSLNNHPELRQIKGKKVFEFQPKIDWDKGKALLWILDRLGFDGPDTCTLYIGDDLTDEDAFCVLGAQDLGIIVRGTTRLTAAQYSLNNTSEVQLFLHLLTSMIRPVES